MNTNTKKTFIINLVTTLIWLIAGVTNLVLQGKYAPMCFIACIVFGYLTVNWYKKWKAEQGE
jgi:hypothetical protein